MCRTRPRTDLSSLSTRFLPGALAFALATVLATACAEGSVGTGPAPGSSDPNGDPGIVGTYDLATVNGIDVPATIVNTKMGPTTLRGEITSGSVAVRADGSYEYRIRGRWWTNGVLTSDRTSVSKGTWSMPSEGEISFDSNGGSSFDMERTWYSLTEMRRVVENGVDATWPYVFVRR